MRVIFATALFLLIMSCRQRAPIEQDARSTSSETDQIFGKVKANAEGLGGVVPANVETSAVAAEVSMAPTVSRFLKPAPSFEKYCTNLKKLEITGSFIRLAADEFGLALENETLGNIQCLVTLNATIPKRTILVPTFKDQAFYAAKGNLTTGESMGLDINIITFSGESIEASQEYQLTAEGPIAADTEFVRYPRLIRKISAPCLDTAVNRTIAIQLILYVNKGEGAAQSTPQIMSRDIPRIDYSFEPC